ncbi:lipocalin family protein [Flavobacterium sp.]|uniref:lipocalin family protein n=1 Tax=Flavobacterium sp. TaxID=239 RepID=UPI00352747D2
MKKLLLLFTVILMVGCKSTSPVATNLDNKVERTLKGMWTITEVSFPGSEYIKVTSFDMFDSQCFVNSDWTFVSNNNKGKMTLNNANCASFSSDITWYINKEGKFVMKVLNAEKSKKVSQGYVLSIANITENSFQLLDKVSVGGSTKDLVYQFTRVNQ